MFYSLYTRKSTFSIGFIGFFDKKSGNLSSPDKESRLTDLFLLSESPHAERGIFTAEFSITSIEKRLPQEEKCGSRNVFLLFTC